MSSALEGVIEQWIAKSETVLRDRLGGFPNPFLVIKYCSPAHAERLLDHKRGINISESINFTWGKAAYVAPLESMFSGMIFGRVGIVGTLERDHMRFYNAVDDRGRELYQEWIRTLPFWYDLLTTTVHANLANNHLRNRFRSQFRIQCIYSPPDQFAERRYVNPNQDLWFAVADVDAAGRLESGTTRLIKDVRPILLIDDEFGPDKHDVFHRRLLQNIVRGASYRAGTPNVKPATVLQEVIKAYRASVSGTKAIVHLLPPS